MTRREKSMVAVMFLLAVLSFAGGYALAQCPEEIEVVCESCPECPEERVCPTVVVPEIPEIECPTRKVKVKCVEKVAEVVTPTGTTILVDPTPQFHIDLLAAIREEGWQTGVAWNWNVSRRVRPVVTFSRDWDETVAESCSLVQGDYRTWRPASMACSPYQARPQATWGAGVIVSLFRK